MGYCIMMEKYFYYGMILFLVLSIFINIAIVSSTYNFEKKMDVYCADKNKEAWVYQQASFLPGKYKYEKVIHNPSKICLSYIGNGN